ncbi:anchored repeat ABC transporter, substrate-binding protein [Actinomyces faecalis]|uniref:anchored repeat ABC transporter, substrate-binding protein n=1 Tax=Actinomyces faecalis TaxID=2722820 RepID=UPI001551FE0D
MIPSRPSRAGRVLAALAAAALVLPGAGCTHSRLAAVDPAHDGALRVVTTTGILADLARHVAGDRAQVSQLVPDGADPHSWEPTLRSVRDVAYADLALSNYLLLEEHALIRTLDANLPASATSVSVAEAAAKKGATILPLVEDRSLDTVWLGMRVVGDGASYGADRASTVELSATKVEGPGQAASYLTTSFGDPQIGFASSDGLEVPGPEGADTTVLPADAHQHMSWGFTRPGIYRVTLAAAVRARPDSPAQPIAPATAVFAVGVSAQDVATREGRTVLSQGHADITADLEHGQVGLAVDTASVPQGLSGKTTPVSSTIGSSMSMVNLDDVVLDVPPRTLAAVPGAPGFRFLGAPGEQVYLLPQAVLGKHVHGDIDPHLWHDAHNAAAYVRVIADALSQIDPEGATQYETNAHQYIQQLDEVDHYVRTTVESIPPDRRRLVTTHDAYGYLAHAYGLEVTGFLAPNPGVEPSVADRVRLSTTLADLRVPAVFLEPNLARTRSPLRTVAQEAGVQVCGLYGDTLDQDAPTYIDMMRANADSLARCLGGEGPPASGGH